MNCKVLRPTLTVILIVCGTLIVWELRVIRGASTSQQIQFEATDLYTYWLPMYEMGFSELRAGRLFLWNPYQQAGTPGAAAAPGPALFYPANLVYMALPIATGMAFVTVLHLVLAIMFAALTGRAFGLSSVGAVVGGCSFGLTAALPLIYWPAWLSSMIWLPLGIGSMERVINGRDLRWLPGVSAAAAMPWLTCNPATATQAYYAFGLYLALSLSFLAKRGVGASVIAKRMLPLVLAFATGVALAAPQILPTLELARDSVRMMGKESFEAFKEFTLPYGEPSVKRLLRDAFLPPSAFRLGYLGAVPLMLAFAALGSRKVLLQVFCFVLTCWGILELTVPDWYLCVRRWIPVLGSLRIPQRTFPVAVLGTSLLAGAGYDALLRARMITGRYMPVSLVTIAGLGLTWFRYPEPAWWIPVGLSGFALATQLWGWARTIMLGPVVVLLLLADFVGYSEARTQLPYVKESWRQTQKHSAMLEQLQKKAGLSRVLLLDANNLRADWAPKTAMAKRVFSIQDYEPLSSQRYAEFFSYAARGRMRDGTDRLPFAGTLDPATFQKPDQRLRRFLNLLSIRYLVGSNLHQLDPEFRQFTARLRPVKIGIRAVDSKGGKFLAFEDPQALPRAYAVYNAECVPALADQLVRLAAPAFDPTRAVVIEGTCKTEANNGVPDSPPTVVINRYRSTYVEIVAQLERSGWLVLTDSFYPGWQATVNGERTKVWRANGVVRAVALPAGTSTVEFRYVPWSLYTGVWIAVAAAILSATWTLQLWRNCAAKSRPCANLPSG